MSVFGKTLYRLLKARKMTQKDFAGIIGLDPSTISRWINGYTYPTLSMRRSVAKYFNVSLKFITTGKDNKLQSDTQLRINPNKLTQPVPQKNNIDEADFLCWRTMLAE